VIRGYVEQPSPRPGDTCTLRVATDAPRWRYAVYRCGTGLEPVGAGGPFHGVAAPPHLPGDDWGRPGVGLDGMPLRAWPAYPLRVGADWPSAVYLVRLVELDAAGADRHPAPTPQTPDARAGSALLVVRAARPTAPVLFKVPVLTYHAYNLAAGDPVRRPATDAWCLYTVPAPGSLPAHVRAGVSLHRPGGGTGGTPWDTHNVDPFDASPRQTFAHWDWPFLGWLERSGYDVDLCTDVDLHREGRSLLAPYRLLVSVGHDEYWSEAMRDAAEGWVAGGGNVAFFGGNTCWWQVVFDDAVTFRRTRPWWEAGRAENALTGVSFRNGGERDNADFPRPVGFRVQHADHWAFAGTGLRDGDVFGVDDYLVGYECDGAEFGRDAVAAGVPATPTCADGTPDDFVILGVGDARESGWGNCNGAATMGVHAPGGTVFTAATTDWVRGLDRDPAVARITRNVLDRLSR
jgi:hypothetical protein